MHIPKIIKCLIECQKQAVKLAQEIGDVASDSHVCDLFHKMDSGAEQL